MALGGKGLWRWSGHRGIQRRTYILVQSSLFFFFQAEDGIRDIGVTGVQTCALPILAASNIALHAAHQPFLDRSVMFDAAMAVDMVLADIEQDADAGIERRRQIDRSEERRVGKECRSRWWPGH